MYGDSIVVPQAIAFIQAYPAAREIGRLSFPIRLEWGMPVPTQGVGNLIVNDLLTDVAFSLFQPCVNVTVPTGGIAVGPQTVLVWDASLYVDAQIVVGANTANIEVVTVTAVVVGTSFSATFTKTHAAGDSITGATFPVQSVAGDPLFLQSEMLQYLSNAVNDFLLAVPLVYAVNDSISVGPTAQYASLPADCMMPVRISAFGIGLRETSQSNLDFYDFRWQQQTGSPPQVYYRDKIPLQSFGVWPRQSNTLPVEIVYEQRGPQLMGLADGFLLPDPFLIYVKARILSFAYSKDGEARSPALAQWSELEIPGRGEDFQGVVGSSKRSEFAVE